MSEHMLHILAPSRFDRVAAIVGDLTALSQLRDAIADAIDSGTGGTYLVQSDGEGYSMAVVQAPDMSPVRTTYAGEVGPQRPKGEMVSMRGLPRFTEAIEKSKPPTLAKFQIPRFLPTQSKSAKARRGRDKTVDCRVDHKNKAPHL
ncbi:hypothetical protein [Massilia glaciei]|uniref:hypothetical protein n=1 Tax=Massilia glaciei TaxID=1524097 RepID=UPI0011B28518|nr:hypothetical protein [Massilia glaciei]